MLMLRKIEGERRQTNRCLIITSSISVTLMFVLLFIWLVGGPKIPHINLRLEYQVTTLSFPSRLKGKQPTRFSDLPQVETMLRP